MIVLRTPPTVIDGSPSAPARRRWAARRSARVLQAAGRELLQLRLTDPEAATHERLLALARRLNSELQQRIR